MKCLKCNHDIDGAICTSCGIDQETYLFDNLDKLELKSILEYIFQSGEFKVDEKVILSVLDDLLIHYKKELNIYKNIINVRLLSEIKEIKNTEDGLRFLNIKTNKILEEFGFKDEIIYNSLKTLIEATNNINLDIKTKSTTNVNKELKIETAVCPSCNEKIQLINKKEIVFCMHCGKRLKVIYNVLGKVIDIRKNYLPTNNVNLSPKPYNTLPPKKRVKKMNYKKLKRISYIHHNGKRRTSKIGFSWGILFFGGLIPLFKGDFKWAFIMMGSMSLLISTTLSWLVIFAMIYFAINYNKLYCKDLIKKGYIPETLIGLNTLSDVKYIYISKYNELKLNYAIRYQ